MKIDDKKLNSFTDNVMEASKLDAKNNINFVNYYGYVFDRCLTAEDRELLEKRRKNTFNFSTLRPFILHGLKGVKDSMPTATFKSLDDNDYSDHPNIPSQIIADQLTEKLTGIFDFSHFDDVVYKVSQDQYIGGKGIFKVRTGYSNDYNLDQTFYIEHIQDPTGIYLDTRSKDSTGKDAEWCAQKIAMCKDKFERTFPNVSWKEIEQTAQTSGKMQEGTFSWIETNIDNKREQLINILDYYYFEYKTRKMYGLPNGQIVEDKPEGVEFRTRTIEEKEVWRIRYCGTHILKSPEKTVFKSLPFIWVAAETYLDDKGRSQLVPYAKHGFDAMRAKNFSLNYYMSDVINRAGHTQRVAEEALTESLKDALQNPQQPKIQVYKSNALDHAGNSQSTGTTPIQDVFAPPLPQELLEAATELDKNLPAIFGTQFPSLNDLNNVSGKALYNMAQYMAASTEILMQNLLQAIVQVSTVIKEGMPEILKSEMITFTEQESQQTKNIMFDYIFTPSRYQIIGHRGVSTQLQKEANFENLVGLSKTVPTFAQFLQTPEVMSELLEMLDLQNEPKWLKLWENYQQQQAQAAGQNPMMQDQQQQMQLEAQKTEAALINAKAKALDSHTRALSMPMEMRQAEEDQALERSKLIEDQRRTELRMHLETAKLNQKSKNDLLNHAEKIYQS